MSTILIHSDKILKDMENEKYPVVISRRKVFCAHQFTFSFSSIFDSVVNDTLYRLFALWQLT